jgi:hypothetical protein
MNLGFEGYVPPEKSVSKEGARRSWAFSRFVLSLVLVLVLVLVLENFGCTTDEFVLVERASTKRFG